MAWLQEWRLCFHKRGGDGSGKCTAFRSGSSNSALYGVLFGLSRAQEKKLDEFEGPGYGSRAVRVETREGSLEAKLYIAKPEFIDDTLLPFDWYRALVVAGARSAQLPLGYVRAIERISPIVDPDAERRARNMALIGARNGLV